MKGLLSFLDSLTPFRITKWCESSENGGMDEREPAGIFDGANVVSSLRTDTKGSGNYHAVLLDLDVPAYLVPSSTEGHSHLYIDVKVNQYRYFKLLDTLADCGIIERGYADVSKKKGGTFLRLPWVKKEKPDVATDPWADIVPKPFF